MSNSTPHPAPDEHAKLKQEAGEYAAGFVRPGMAVGLGTGSTAIFATRRIAELFSQGRLQGILGFATSTAVREEAIRLGASGAIPLAPLVSRCIPLEALQEGMEQALGGGPVMKVLVDVTA